MKRNSLSVATLSLVLVLLVPGFAHAGAGASACQQMVKETGGSKGDFLDCMDSALTNQVAENNRITKALFARSRGNEKTGEGTLVNFRFQLENLVKESRAHRSHYCGLLFSSLPDSSESQSCDLNLETSLTNELRLSTKALELELANQ